MQQLDVEYGYNLVKPSESINCVAEGNQVSSQAQFTQLLESYKEGQSDALNAITEMVYTELRQMARAHMSGESRSHTLQATELVNEAFLRMVNPDIDYKNRVHFLSIAATMMRRILTDHARAKQRVKRGADFQQITLNEEIMGSGVMSLDILTLDDAMNKLADLDPRKAKIIEQQYFAGMSAVQIADAMGLSSRTVEREAQFSRAWLLNQMSQ